MSFERALLLKTQKESEKSGGVQSMTVSNTAYEHLARNDLMATAGTWIIFCCCLSRFVSIRSSYVNVQNVLLRGSYAYFAHLELARRGELQLIE
jgi:hypothetical protein